MCLPDKTATYGANVKATYCSYIPKTGSCASMHPPDTTAMDDGSAEHAGAIFCPYILTPAPVHPCTRRIPYILYIKNGLPREP